MRIRFWGTRGSIASPGRDTVRFGGNTSCIQLQTASGEQLVFDCGTGARLLGNHLLANAKGSSISATLMLTHTHWDHIQGFPFFAPLFVPGNKFKVFGPDGTVLSLHDVLSGQMEHHYFPVELDQLAAGIAYEDLGEGTREICGLNIRAQKMNHPAPTLGYRVTEKDRCFCYLSDHEPFVEAIWRDGAEPGNKDSIADDGDFQHMEYMQGAHVVVHEAQYTPEEYPAKKNWGHSTFRYAVQMAALAGVERLYLSHHDPTHADDFIDEIERRSRELTKSIGSKMEVFCAYEGCEVEV